MFNPLIQKVYKTVYGETTLEELEELSRLASKADRPIVEIGTKRGRSTFAMALSTEQTVVAVDPWGNGENSDFICFLSDIIRLGIRNIKVLPYKSRKAFREWCSEWCNISADKSIFMVFIDGDHSYEECKFDFVSWGSLVVPEGYVVFHDADWEGVDKVIRNHVKEEKYKLVKTFSFPSNMKVFLRLEK